MNFNKNNKILVAAGVVAIATAAGITTLYLHKDSIFKTKKAAPQPQTEKVEPTHEAESVNVCDYSMVEAFQKGLINSVSEYVDKTPYRVDTIPLNLNECDKVSKGYYTQISTEDTILEEYITVNYLKPDTTNIPDPLKRLLLRFAQETNDSIQQKSVVAHEVHHAKHDFSNYNLKAKERADLSNFEEITGRLWQFIYLREQYKINNDSTVFKSDFRFYQYALRRGEINPRSTDSTEQRTEQLFVLRNLFEQNAQNYVDLYEEEVINDLKKAKDYDPNIPNQYPQALAQLFTVIWDGKLVNLDPISTGELEAPTLPENVQTYVNCLTSKEEYRISQSDTNKTNIDTTNLFLEKQNTMDNR